jgi:DNA processing protein
MNINEKYILLLNYLFHDAPRRAYDIFQRFPSKEDFVRAFDNYANSHKIKNSAQIKRILNSFDCEKYILSLNKNNIKTLFYSSDKYPDSLKEISDPPLVLFYKGQVEHLSDELIAVVGPRAVSKYGDAVTSTLSKELLGYFTIVSGMAQGVDSIAHSTAIKYGKPTIAVLGTGLNIIYPENNTNLFHEIISNGLVMSEYPPDTTPMPYRFPQRNRIISGLSKGVVVCEAGFKSGAMITARLALEQNREVFAVPGSIFSTSAMGVNALIQQGAKLIQNAEDVVSEFNYLFKPVKNRSKPILPSSLNTEQKNISTQDVQAFQLNEDEKNILNFISDEPIHIDTIVTKTQLSIHQILQYLTFFELNDMVKQLPGKYFQLKNIYTVK